MAAVSPYTSHLKRRETKDAQGSAHFKKQVGNPTSTTSHLKSRETQDAQGSAHFLIIYKWVLKLSFN
jgi:hypothetical protein